MNNWLNPEQDLGNIPQGIDILVVFKYEGTTKIENVIPTCACSRPEWDDHNKEVRITYSPGNVPFHLEQQGNYKSVKKIIVRQADNTEVLLTFTAIVHKVLPL